MADKTSASVIIKRYRHLLAIAIIIILLVAAWLLYYCTKSNIPETTKTFCMVITGVILNLVSTVIVFLIVSVMFARENEQELQAIIQNAVSESLTIPATLDQVRWSDFIDQASEIDFVVQGWDGWAERPDIAKALASFFERGGVFNLYTCEPHSGEASQSRGLIGERLDRAPHSVVVEIEGTYRNIKSIQEQATKSGKVLSRLEVYGVNRVNWYFAVLFKGKKGDGTIRSRDVFLFSIYSHTPRPPWKMPVTITHPDLHEGLLDWFEKELQYLKRKVEPEQASTNIKNSHHGEK